MEQRISREDLIKIYNVELSFFNDLAKSGLIRTEINDQVSYLLYEELPTFEKFANWHYDLDINMAGLEVIHSLLEKLNTLQQENRRIKHLQFLADNGLWEDADIG